MAKSIKLRQGTETEHEAFTGQMAEVTFDTTNNRIVLHDGTTPGGIPMAKLSDVPVDLTDLTDVDDNLTSVTGGGAAFSGTTYVVTVASGTNTYGTGNKYYITDETGASPTVTLTEGETYRFDQSDSTNTGHPLKFSTTANGTHDSGSEYTTGVTYNGVPGQAGAYTEITVEVGAPTLYYYCQVHSGMGSVGAAPAENSLVLNSSNTVLLATATGTSDNNNITDSSTNNHSITVNGDVMAGTFSPYRSGGYSTYFDGSGDKLTLGGSALSDFNFGTNSFSIEFWMYPTGAPGPIFTTHKAGEPNGYYLYAATGTNQFIFGQYVGQGGGNDYSTVNAYALNEWNHVSLNRDAENGNSLKLYVNGSLVLTTTNSVDYNSYAYGPYIGGYDAGGTQYDFEGYISDLIVTNGSVLRTGGTSLSDVAFTPPTEVFESDADTALLISSSLPYIKDSSSRSHDITVTGDVSKMPSTPYDYNGYNPSIHGGSVYFDGSGDYLKVNDTNIANFGNNDFTIETWIYRNDTARLRLVDTRPTNGNGAYVTLGIHADGGVEFYSNGSNLMGGNVGTINVGQWHHVAWVRNSGTINIYINGISVGSVSNSTNFISSNFAIGLNSWGGEWPGSFNISDFHITKDVARYTANFTPPTAPLSSSGSSLHIKGTDASIIDKSQTTNIQLFGNTTGSTTQVKFADTKSMYFDGSDDRALVTAPLDLLDFSNGESYTLETWVNATDLSGSSWRTICNNGTTNVYGPIYLSFLGDKLHALASHNGSSYTLDTRSDIGSSGIATFVTNTWYHIAYTWDGSDYKFYVDGVLLHTITKTGAPMSPVIDLGIGARAGNYELFNGYIQDFRITKGLVRYTANFTPPTKSLGSNVVPAAPAAGPAPMWSLSGDSATFAAATTDKLDTNATNYVALNHPTGWGNSWGLEDGSYAMHNNSNILNDPTNRSVHIWSTDDLSEGMTYQYYVKFDFVQPTAWENMTVISAGSSAAYSYTQWMAANNGPNQLAWGSNGAYGYYTHSADGSGSADSIRLDNQGWLHFAIELQSNGRLVHYVNGVVVVNVDASDVSSLTNKANVFFGSVHSWMTDIEVYTGGGIHNPDLLETPPGFTPPARKQA